MGSGNMAPGRSGSHVENRLVVVRAKGESPSGHGSLDERWTFGMISGKEVENDGFGWVWKAVLGFFYWVRY